LQRLPEETAFLNEHNKLFQFCSRDHLVWIVKDDERPLRKDHARISFIECDFVTSPMSIPRDLPVRSPIGWDRVSDGISVKPHDATE
jgi:hypothetical protein